MATTTELFSLPQELVGEIFDLAYPGGELPPIARNVTPRGRNSQAKATSAIYRTPEQWARNQKSLLHYGHISLEQKYPGPKANQFMVSRTFFENAARAWAANQCFNDLDSQAFPGLSYGMIDQQSSIVYKYATSILLYCCSKFGHPGLPSLQKLDVHVTLSDMAMGTKKPEEDMYTEVLNEKDLQDAAKFNGLDSLPEVKELKLLGHIDTVRQAVGMSDSDRLLWDKNMQALEDHVKKITKGRLIET